MYNQVEDMDALLAQAVRRRREELGLTQHEVAEAASAAPGVNLTFTTLSRIEAGSRAVRYAEAVALADVLNFPLPGIHKADESPEEVRRRYLDLSTRHLRSKVGSAQAAVGAARARLHLAERLQDAVNGVRQAIEGKPVEVEAHDIQSFGRNLLSAVEEAGIPIQEFLDALELPPTDMYDHGPEAISADMDPGYIAKAIADKYPLKIKETWTDIEDATHG